jgi:hypothetical protein
MEAKQVRKPQCDQDAERVRSHQPDGDGPVPIDRSGLRLRAGDRLDDRTLIRRGTIQRHVDGALMNVDVRDVPSRGEEIALLDIPGGLVVWDEVFRCQEFTPRSDGSRRKRALCHGRLGDTAPKRIMKS